MRLQFWVKEQEQGKKLSVFLRMRKVSANLIRQIKYTQPGFLVNGVPVYTNYLVNVGDLVSCILPQEKSILQPQPTVQLDIIKETEHFVLVNKPANLVVHPTMTHESGTLANGWLAVLASRGQQGTFHAVNRLDKDTSGLVLIAKNTYAASLLPKCVEKQYLAILQGEIPLDSGGIHLPIARCEDSAIKRQVSDNGQVSSTLYQVLAKGNGYSLVKVKLLTGRTHQIRVHFSAIGYPLVGDWLYEGECKEMHRQALHCFGMKISNFLENSYDWITAPPPKDMQEFYHKIIASTKR